MSETRKAVIQLEVDLKDGGGVAREVKRLEAELGLLEAQQTDATRAFDRGDVSAAQYRQTLAALEGDARRTSQALDDLSRPREIDVRTQRFDAVSRDVGLAGDVQSNLGAIGGLTSAAGLGGVGGGIGAAGELVALVEELPRLKTAAQGLPATIGAAGQALGTSGAGLIGSIGALGLAAGAVALAVKVAASEIDKSLANLDRAIDAQIEAEQLVRSGGTSDEARQRIESLRAEAEAIRAVEAQVRGFNESLTALADNRFLKRLPGINGLRERLEKLDTTADAAEKRAAALEQALDAGRFEAADRAQAEEAAAEKTAQAASKRQSELDSLLASETKTTDSIKLLQSALASGTLTADERAAAESKLASLMEQVAAATDEASAAISRFSLTANNIEQDSFGVNKVGGGGTSTRSTPTRAETAPRRNAAADIQKQIAQAERKAGQARVDAALQFNRDIQDIETRNQRQLADIRRQSARDAADAARSRDFAGLFTLKERTSEQIADANLAAQRESADRQRALDRRLADLNRANERELQQLRAKVQAEGRILQQGYNNALGMARGFVRGLENEFRRGQQSNIRRQVRAEMQAVAGGGA